MAFTTDLLVKSIIDTDEEGIPDLTPFIDSAHELVVELCLTWGYSDKRLELIERWLAAFFYALDDPRTTKEHTGPLHDEFETKVDLGFNLNKYGQAAMRLDTAGALAALNGAIIAAKRPVKAMKLIASIHVIGGDTCCP